MFDGPATLTMMAARATPIFEEVAATVILRLRAGVQ
jgi:hypothetical protein